MPKTETTSEGKPKIKAPAVASSEFLRGLAGEAHAAPTTTAPAPLGETRDMGHPSWPPNELAAISQTMGRNDRGESLELSDTPTYMKGTPAPT